MDYKYIKLLLKSQLKKQYPNLKRITRKKRAIGKKATAEVTKLYDFNKPITDL